MKKTIKEAVFEAIDHNVGSIKNMDELMAYVREQTGTKVSDKRLIGYMKRPIRESLSLNYTINHAGELIYRKDLFAKSRFLIKLNDNELKNQEMIVGHRPVPFCDGRFTQSMANFVDENGKELEIRQRKERLNTENHIYFSFLVLTDEVEVIEEKVFIPIYSVNLESWIKKHDFKKKDYIEVSVVDINKHIYRIEKKSSKDIASRTFISQQKREELKKLVVEGIDSKNTNPIGYSLFRAFANAKPGTVEAPENTMAEIVNNLEGVQMELGGDYLYLQNLDDLEAMAEAALRDSFVPREMGKAKDIQGILDEMSISFDKFFIKAFFYNQLHRKGIDIDEFLDVLLRPGQKFANERQAINFEKAINKITNEAKKLYAKKKLGTHQLKLLQFVLAFEIEIVQHLRQLELHLQENNYQDFNPTSLIPLQKFEAIIISVFQEITSEKQISESKAEQVLKDIKKMPALFKKTFNEIFGL